MRPPGGWRGPRFSRAADASAGATSFELLPKIFSSRAAEPSGVAYERTRDIAAFTGPIYGYGNARKT